jgi:hypothetical protein
MCYDIIVYLLQFIATFCALMNIILCQQSDCNALRIYVSYSAQVSPGKPDMS